MGFALGFLSAFAVLTILFALRVRRWRRWRRGRDFAPVGARWMFRGLFARLGTSPSQEQVLVDDATALREVVAALRSDWEGARGELAELIATADLDAGRVDAVLAAREARFAELRRRAAEAVARFHAVLDAEQRQALSRWVREGRLLAPANGGAAWRRGC